MVLQQLEVQRGAGALVGTWAAVGTGPERGSKAPVQGPPRAVPLCWSGQWQIHHYFQPHQDFDLELVCLSEDFFPSSDHLRKKHQIY